MRVILIFIFSLIYHTSYSQKDDFLIHGKSLYELKNVVLEIPLISPHFYSYTFIKKEISIPKKKPASFKVKKYTGKAHSAFFCRLEDRLEQKTQTAFRFRLGTLEHVNQLEGKR